MDIALWITSGILAAIFILSGVMKTLQPKEKLLASLPWTEDYSPLTIKLIGVAELLGGLGLILPWVTGIAPILTPIAATGLAVIQVLAIFAHLRRGEAKVVAFNAVLLLGAVFIAVFRFAAL